MLLDWLTLVCEYETDPVLDRAARSFGSRIMKVSAATGAVEWETSAWESVRSDSHQIAVKVGAGVIRVQGSPARCMRGDQVFGDPEHAMDPWRCAMAMLNGARAASGLPLPLLSDRWRVTRVDVTENFVLPDLAAVRQALTALRDVEGGRYRVSQTAGDTVYWSHRSRLRSGKAYGKGPHILRQVRRGEAGYTESQLHAADRLLRLELALRAQWWREVCDKWVWDMGPEDFRREFWAFFGRMVSDVEVVDQCDLMERLCAVTTGGQARAAMGTLALIQAHGWEAARELVSRRTWYRHLELLRKAGLGDAELSSGRASRLVRSVDLSAVCSWEELRLAA